MLFRFVFNIKCRIEGKEMKMQKQMLKRKNVNTSSEDFVLSLKTTATNSYFAYLNEQLISVNKQSDDLQKRIRKNLDTLMPQNKPKKGEILALYDSIELMQSSVDQIIEKLKSTNDLYEWDSHHINKEDNKS